MHIYIYIFACDLSLFPFGIFMNMRENTMCSQDIQVNKYIMNKIKMYFSANCI